MINLTNFLYFRMDKSALTFDTVLGIQANLSISKTLIIWRSLVKNRC